MALINGEVIDESDFIKQSERNVDRSLDFGKTIKFEEDGYIHSDFVRTKYELTTFDHMNGEAVPVPIFINSDGTLLRSSAASGSSRQKCHGFYLGPDTLLELPRYFAGTESASSTFSLTVPAGTNRYLLVFTYHSGAAAAPTAVSWNGTSLTKIEDDISTNAGVTLWTLPLGSGVEVTANVVVTGGAGTFKSHQALVYENVHQTLGIADSAVANINGSPVSTPSLTAVDLFSTFVYGGVTQGATITLSIANTIERQNLSNRARTGDFALIGNSVATVSGSTQTAVVGAALRAASAAIADIILDRVVPGFTGLTPGASYFVSNATGQISTTPGTLSIPVGVALSATHLMVTI